MNKIDMSKYDMSKKEHFKVRPESGINFNDYIGKEVSIVYQPRLEIDKKTGKFRIFKELVDIKESTSNTKKPY